MTQGREIDYEFLISENQRLKSLLNDNQSSMEIESDILFRLAFENANIGMCIVSTEGVLLKVNRQMTEIFGYSKSELEGMTTNDIAHPDYKDISPIFIKKATSGEMDHTEFEKKYIHKNGTQIIAEVSSSLVKDQNGNPVCFISHVKDITIRRNAEEELKRTKELSDAYANELFRLATLDSLTRIPNRRKFEDYYTTIWNIHLSDNLPLTIIFIDIDYFKNYNDYYGHIQGDECLKLVASALSGVIENSNGFVSRFGGEEFIVLLENSGVENGKIIAEEIVAEIRKLAIPHEKSEVSDYITLSIGVASLVPNHTINSTDLISIADQSLYLAKNSGRNRIIIYND